MEYDGWNSTAKSTKSCGDGFCSNLTTKNYGSSVLVTPTTAPPPPNIAVDPVIALSSVGIAVAVAGALANLASLAASVSARCRNHGQRLGLISLSAAGLVEAVAIAMVLIFAAHWVVAKHWEHPEETGIYRQEYCVNEVFKWIFAVGCDSNLFTLAFLAAQQFAAIRWPLKFSDGTSKRSCYAWLAAAWAGGSAYAFARSAVIVSSTSSHPNVNLWPTKGTTRFCYQLILYEARDAENRLKYSFGQAESNMGLLMLRVAIQCSVLATIVVAYGYVIFVIVRRYRQADSIGRSSTDKLAAKRQRSLHKAAGVMALITLLMVACYWPLFVYGALQSLEITPRNEPMTPIALYGLTAVATLADPLIYTFRIKSMRNGAARIVSKCSPICRRMLRRKIDSMRSSTGTMSSTVL